MPHTDVVYGGHSARIASLESAVAGSIDCRSLAEPITPDDEFEKLVTAAREKLRANQTLDINCKQGRHRSPTVTIVAIWKELGTHSLQAVYDAVTAAYPAGTDHTPDTEKILASLEVILLKWARNRVSRRANVRQTVMAAQANTW